MPQPVVGHFEKVAAGLWLEGLAVDTERNIVWYSDVIGGGVHGMMPNGSIRSMQQDRKWSAGVLLNSDGCVLVSGPGGIMWHDPGSERSGWLLDQIDGKPISGINEMFPDGTGGIYFGTCDLENITRGQTPRPSAIYRLTVAGEAIKVAEGINFSNGMMLSPDGTQFYCNDSFTGTFAFDVLPDRTLTNRRLLLTKKDCDGMALDADGNAWITGFASREISRVRPDGQQLPSIPTLAGAVTQIRFGGADMKDYYICTVPADGGAKLKKGILPTEPDSILYRGRAERPGMRIPPTRLVLK